MNEEIDLYCDGSPGETRAFQAGYLRGVVEGKHIGRQQLAQEQIEAQKDLHERLGINELVQGQINYLKTVPAQRREELAGRGTRQNERRLAA